jgi:hypothetical protein
MIKNILMLVCLFTFLKGCYVTGELTTLGRDTQFIYYQTKEDLTPQLKKIVYGNRNPWAYPLILIGYPVAVSLDLLISPYYLYKILSKKKV